MTDEKLYSTTDQGLASFLVYVLSDNAFARVELRGKQPLIFINDTVAASSCAELARMYHSGAQLRDVKDFCHCYKLISFAVRDAYRAQRNSKQIETRGNDNGIRSLQLLHGRS